MSLGAGPSFAVGERVVVSVAPDRTGRWTSSITPRRPFRTASAYEFQVAERITGHPLREPKYLVRLDEPVRLWEHASETTGFWFEEPEVIRE